MPLGISVALTLPSAVMASYYLLLQTYVLRLEAIMNGILLLFCGAELLLEVLTLAAFSRSGPPQGDVLLWEGGLDVCLSCFLWNVPSRQDTLLSLWSQETWNMNSLGQMLTHLPVTLPFCLSFCHQYGQDLKCRGFSLQPIRPTYPSTSASL